MILSKKERLLVSIPEQILFIAPNKWPVLEELPFPRPNPCSIRKNPAVVRIRRPLTLFPPSGPPLTSEF